MREGIMGDERNEDLAAAAGEKDISAGLFQAGVRVGAGFLDLVTFSKTGAPIFTLTANAVLSVLGQNREEVVQIAKQVVEQEFAAELPKIHKQIEDGDEEVARRLFEMFADLERAAREPDEAVRQAWARFSARRLCSGPGQLVSSEISSALNQMTSLDLVLLRESTNGGVLLLHEGSAPSFSASLSDLPPALVAAVKGFAFDGKRNLLLRSKARLVTLGLLKSEGELKGDLGLDGASTELGSEDVAAERFSPMVEGSCEPTTLGRTLLRLTRELDRQEGEGA
jgi:hypothetical protein